MIVCKFGGSSLGNAESIIKVKNIIQEKVSNNEHLVLVFSAVGNTTDRLINIGNSAADKNVTSDFDSVDVEDEVPF